MLADELMHVSPEAPLSRGGAWRLVSGSLGACGKADALAVPLAVAGARGRALLRKGEPALSEGAWVCAIGAFDGLHLGHRELIRRAREEADRRGARLAALTFSPDPADVLDGPKPSSQLLSCEERQLGLLSLGADAVIALDFTRALSALSYGDFMRDVLLGTLDVRCVVVGSDFRLGAGGAGTVRALRELGRSAGFDVLGLDLLDADGAAVTATRIRGLVHAGRVEAAAGLLGRCHCVPGIVEHGRGEGTSFGFPTANVMVEASRCMPEQGVYAAYVTLDGANGPIGAWPAAVNVGLPPTFEGETRADGAGRVLLEANLIGFAGDAYGMGAHVTLVRWLRDSRPFSSLAELEATVLGNIEWTSRALGAADVMGEGALA